MKTFVTGATGFLGKNLIKHLIENGDEVTALVRKHSEELPEEVVQIQGDVTDSDSLTFSGQEVVYHLAGVVGYSKAQRQLMEEVNIQGTKNVVENVRKYNVDRLIHMSSVVTVGASFKPEALNEENAYNLAHLDLGYFETKRQAEEVVTDEVAKGKINAVILNPSTIYGEGDMLKGSRKVQLKVANGKFPFYPPGGVNVVDVDNVVQSTIDAVELGRNGERYILAGENLYIKELFNIIADVAGVSPPLLKLPTQLLRTIGKAGDFLEKYDKKGPINSENAWAATLYHWFDSTKAQKELGLRVTPAANSIRKSITWAKQHGLIGG